jgi:hypothetical protein
MIRLCRITLSALIIASSTVLPVSSQQNLLDYENSMKFAGYLKSTLQYNFAMQEYERINFLWPGDSLVIMELVQTYRLNDQCDKLDRAFALIQDNIRKHNSVRSAKEYLNFALKCRSESSRFFDLSVKLKPEERNFYNLAYYWVNQEYNSAFNYCQSRIESGQAIKSGLFQLTLDFQNEKYKSPAVSVLMSAFVPGSGKLYSGRFGDAMVSFLSVTTNTWAAWRAFNKKGIQSANGWIFGSLAFGFYSANLWGSAKAAKTYNSNLKKRYQSDAENIIYSSF